jgi:uncharacterized protein
MKDFIKCYGEWALIAGAAEGIGVAFTEQVAGKKMNIIMVDIKGPAMEELAANVERLYGIKTIRVVLDLTEKDAWIKCMNAINSLDCRLMVYVSAYSPVNVFLDNSPDELDKFLDLNSRTPMKMVLEFGKRVKNTKHSGIILMSSLAGLIGPQYTAPYAATKAFTNIFGEALYHELKRYHTDVLVCCAGPVSTPTYWSSQPAHRNTHSKVLDPAKVAAFALKNLGKKALCIPGWKNRLSFYLLMRILPRKTAAKLVNTTIAKMYPQFR